MRSSTTLVSAAVLVLAVGCAGSRAPEAGSGQVRLPSQAPSRVWAWEGFDPVSLAVADGRAFVAGVRAVGPRTGAFAVFREGRIVPELGDPDVDGGNVTAIVGDGAGGWVLAGSFTTVGGTPCNGLAHVTAAHRLDRRMCLGVKGTVATLARRGHTVYLAGMLSGVGGERRSKLAAVDLSSARVLPWTATVGGRPFYDEGGGRHDLVPRRVNALAVLGDVVYVAGYFEKVGGKTRKNVAALDASSGRVLDWRADAGEPLGPSADLDYVSVLAAVPGRLYVAGNFREIAGSARDGVGAVDPTTGRVLDWKVRAPAEFIHGHGSGPYDIAVAAGHVYLAGHFEWGDTNPELVVVDADSGRARPDRRFTGGGPDSWTGGDMTVAALATDGERLYLGGDFEGGGGRPWASLAVIDLRTNSRLDWGPAAIGGVTALAAQNGAVAAGGGFTGIATALRDGLASFDLRSGRLLPWDPDLSGPPDPFNFRPNPVSALAASDSTLYLGGSFVAVEGQPRAGLAAFDLATGKLTDWAPTLEGPERFEPVDVMAVAEGVVYIGGPIASINGEPRAGLAAIDASSGELEDWNPGLEDPLYDDIYSLAPVDGLVYVTALDFDGRPAVSDIEASEWLPWQPTLSETYGVTDEVDVALHHDGRLYLGGDFHSFDGYPRRGLVALDPKTREVLPLDDPNLVRGLTGVGSLAASDELLAVTGPAGHVLLLDAANGRRLPWAPRGNPQCGEIALDPSALVGFCGEGLMFFPRGS